MRGSRIFSGGEGGVQGIIVFAFQLARLWNAVYHQRLYFEEKNYYEKLYEIYSD